MRYVPNLIPKHLKVLPEYFKGNPYIYSKKNKVIGVLSYFGAILLLLSSFGFIDFMPLFIIFGSLGLVLLPPIHNWLEKTLRFQFTLKIKSAFCVILLLLAVPFINQYDKQLQAIAYEQEQLKLKQEQERAAAELKEKQRIDSFNYHIALIKKLSNEDDLDESNKEIQKALAFAINNNEKEAVQEEKDNLDKKAAIRLIKSRKYGEALVILSNLLNSYPRNNELLYNRAVCLHKTGKIQEAVDDLKVAMNNGDEPSRKYHDKINPIRKRIVGYTTLCCDGSTSGATGRGACSWHGGVCEWNHPIYQEYRKYD